MFRRTSRIIPLAAITATALCLHASRTTGPKPDLRETPQTIATTILRLEKLLDEAESHHRVAKVDEMIADDYWGVTIGGGIITKRDVLAAVGGTEEASSESSDQDVRLLDNAAVYTALVLDHGINQKTQEPYTLATRVMDIWQKRGREWKLVNDQATAVAVKSGEQGRP
jgi:hypothetical protein